MAIVVLISILFDSAAATSLARTYTFLNAPRQGKKHFICLLKGEFTQ